MNKNKGIQSTRKNIRAVTDLPIGARYAQAVATLSKTESTVSDVFYAARKFHLDAAKLLRRALEALPA